MQDLKSIHEIKFISSKKKLTIYYFTRPKIVIFGNKAKNKYSFILRTLSTIDKIKLIRDHRDFFVNELKKELNSYFLGLDKYFKIEGNTSSLFEISISKSRFLFNFPVKNYYPSPSIFLKKIFNSPADFSKRNFHNSFLRSISSLSFLKVRNEFMGESNSSLSKKNVSNSKVEKFFLKERKILKKERNLKPQRIIKKKKDYFSLWKNKYTPQTEMSMFSHYREPTIFFDATSSFKELIVKVTNSIILTLLKRRNDSLILLNRELVTIDEAFLNLSKDGESFPCFILREIVFENTLLILRNFLK